MKLADLLMQWECGIVQYTAAAWEEILQRDDQVSAMSRARRSLAAGLTWQILTVNDTPEALLHKTILEDFYNNITVSHVLDEDTAGGVSLLVSQMLGAIGMGYAVHEIIWAPRPGGLSAEFRFVPLRFFERRSGRLAFLPYEGAIEGEPLEEAGWIVTKGDGLMVASSIAYLFKSMTLRQWVGFCEKFGSPALHAVTSAARGSEEWDALSEALSGFGEELALVTNEGVRITPIELQRIDAIPHPKLVDRMDCAITRIWLGREFSALPGGTADELAMRCLASSDAALVSDTLQTYVDRWVVKYRTGSDKPLAYFSLRPPEAVDLELRMRVDSFAINIGLPVGVNFLRERYGLPKPKPGDELARPSANPFKKSGLAAALAAHGNEGTRR